MNSIEIFTGAGGLALGTEQAGFNHKALIELNPHAVEALYRNQQGSARAYQGAKIYSGCAKKLLGEMKSLYSIDFLSGGPPCQPFSQAGRSLGGDDPRNMFPTAVRYVKELKPKAFLFENVKGLSNKHLINYLEYIKLTLTFPQIENQKNDWRGHHAQLQKYLLAKDKGTDLHYNVFAGCLNAADYGAPQKRERLFIVGFRKDLDIDWSMPLATHSEEALVAAQWQTGEYWHDNEVPRNQIPDITKREISILKKINSAAYKKSTQPWPTIRNAIEDLACQSSNIQGHTMREGARAYKGHTGSPYDQPSKTIKAGVHGVPGGENMIRFHNGSVRYLTVREAARIQGFPDNYLFSENWSSAMRQIGNAVPVSISKIISLSIMQALTEARK